MVCNKKKLLWVFGAYRKILPFNDKTNKMTSAPSEDSDQPAHPRRLIRFLLCTQWEAKDPRFLHVDSED